MNILGLIPARGGSKSIPHKNITPLASRPLLAYTCEEALKSKMLNRIILSTDDKDIERVGSECGVEIPFLRPPELALDDTPSIAVARHALEWLWSTENWQADILVLLQPTSPLRRAKHIDEAIQTLIDLGADTVVSVTEVPHRFSPYSLMTLENGWLTSFWREPISFDRYHRQSLPKLYGRNGPAVLVSRVKTILNSNSFYGLLVAPYVMAPAESVDIDGPFDLIIAETLLHLRT